VQVQAAHAHGSQQDELPGSVGDLGMKASNLLVETLVVESVSAVQHGKDGAILAAGLYLRRSEIRQPHRPGVGFGKRRRTGPRTAGQQGYYTQNDRCCGSHGEFSQAYAQASRRAWPGGVGTFRTAGPSPAARLRRH